MVNGARDDSQRAAEVANSEVRRLFSDAMKTRGGGWSVENLLDSLFLIESAALIQRGQIIDQNLTIIGLLEETLESRPMG